MHIGGPTNMGIGNTFNYTHTLPLCPQKLGWKLFRGHHTKKSFATSFLGLAFPITPHNKQVWRVRHKLGFFRNWPLSHFRGYHFLFPSLLVLFIHCWVYLLEEEIRFPYNSPFGVGQIFTILEQRNYWSPTKFEASSQVGAPFENLFSASPAKLFFLRNDSLSRFWWGSV